MPEKAVYTLTDSGKSQFEKLMIEISLKPIHIFLDFNAVIVNLDGLSRENQKVCLANIEDNIKTLKAYLEENENLNPQNRNSSFRTAAHSYTGNRNMDCVNERAF